MATSGTFTSTRSGTRPWLTLAWSRAETDIAGNRSKIRLVLRLHSSYRINFSANKTGALHGESFTYTGGMSSSGSVIVRQRDVWITHNADGSKTQSFSGNFNLNITWSGVYTGNITVSGNAVIDAIPRASALTAFSLPTHFQANTAVNLNYTVDRKSSSFRHQFQLRDGSTTVAQWDNIDHNGSDTLNISAAQVNTILNRMSSVTTRSFTLRVATRSGHNGGWIGSAVTRNATGTINANVRPTATNLEISQVGNTVTSHYLQSTSKVQARFTRSPGYGATITSSRITVSRSGDSQTINSNSGTTARAISGSGEYTVTAVATDSRGRTNTTLATTFTGTAYSFPTISNFSAVRKMNDQTIVAITSSGNFTSLSSGNKLTVSIQKNSGGAWVNAGSNATMTGGSFTENRDNTGNSEATSYTFRITITDSFGNGATSEVSVPTERVVLDIHKDEGVGIGKIHERGVLDVGGDVYVAGNLRVNGSVINPSPKTVYQTPSMAPDTVVNIANEDRGTYMVYLSNGSLYKIVIITRWSPTAAQAHLVAGNGLNSLVDVSGANMWVDSKNQWIQVSVVKVT